MKVTRAQLAGIVVQHLRHGGFTTAEVCNFIKLPAATVETLFLEAEAQRPKLCEERCTQLPACPYCDATNELTEYAKAKAAESNEV